MLQGLRKLSAAAVAIAVGVASIAGCADNARPTGISFDLSATAAAVLGDITVTGRTNLPDGGVVTVYAWSDAEPHAEWTDYATVTSGVFSARLPTAASTAQLIHLSVAISGDTKQSNRVLNLIGADGARLTGD